MPLDAKRRTASYVLQNDCCAVFTKGFGKQDGRYLCMAPDSQELISA